MRGAVRSLLRAAVGAGAGVPHRRGIRTGLGIQCGAFQGRRRRRPSIASGCVCAIVCLLRPGLAQRTNESQNVAQRTSSYTLAYTWSIIGIHRWLRSSTVVGGLHS